jgi:CheY-like chemotaxis protein
MMAVILVVDDEEAVRRFVSTVLQMSGHQVLLGSNGLEAVATYRSYTDRIALVITDIRMPVMDGVQAVLRIRETRSDARIICMSGDSGERCPAGAAFLEKPFSVETLRTCVAQTLSR